MVNVRYGPDASKEVSGLDVEKDQMRKPDRLDLQNKEFDTLTVLAAKWKTLQQVAIVDDDYPEYRHYYESALKDFVDALKANGRI